MESASMVRLDGRATKRSPNLEHSTAVAFSRCSDGVATGESWKDLRCGYLRCLPKVGGIYRELIAAVTARIDEKRGHSALQSLAVDRPHVVGKDCLVFRSMVQVGLDANKTLVVLVLSMRYLAGSFQRFVKRRAFDFDNLGVHHSSDKFVAPHFGLHCLI